MGNYVDADKIGHPYAVIWASCPLEADWFAKLTADGYEGKKILIHTDPLKRGCRSEHPNYSFLIPTADLEDMVYRALCE